MIRHGVLLVPDFACMTRENYIMKKIIITAVLFALLLFAVPASADVKWNTYAPFAIMYHRISDEETSDAFTITSQSFEADIKYLSENGYVFCTAEEFDTRIKSGDTEKIIAVTFDDGYTSDIEIALPILEKYNAKATFFVIGELIGTDGYMSREQLNELSGSECAEIGNHSYALHNMPAQRVESFYYSADLTFAYNDFMQNKNLLEQITGKRVCAVSYPLGLYSRYFDSLLKRNGMITFSSEQKTAGDSSIPYGRFNRAADIPADMITSRASKR